MKLWFDFKYALRLLKKTPSFSTQCMVVVTFGVAIVLYAFTFVYEVNHRSPPFPNGDRFAVIKFFISGTNYQLGPASNKYVRNRLAEANQSFDVLGIVDTEFAVFNGESTDGESTYGESTQQFYAGIIEPALLNMTEKPPLLGRSLVDDDAKLGATPVVLLGFDVWQSYFAANPDVIGAQTNINGISRTIVGVMPKDFQIARPYQLWLPALVSPTASVEDTKQYRIIGAIKAGITFAEASADINKILTDMAADYPTYFENRDARVQAIGLIGSGDLGNKWLLFVVTLLIMLLTAVNLSSMLFVRASSRQRELSVRSAVGASKWDVVRQVLLESFIFCFIGTVIAIGVADFALRNTEFDNPINLMSPSWQELRIHPNELLVAVALMLLVWLASSLTTVFRLLRQDVVTALESGQGSGSRTLNITTRIIVGMELVVAFLILIACGSLSATIADSYSHDYGADSNNVVTARIGLRGQNYQDPTQRQIFIDQLRRALSGNSIFKGISISTAPPGTQGTSLPFLLGDREVNANERLPRVGLISISQNYFDMMGVEIIDGRPFSSADNSNNEAVVIINDNFAQKFWPNESPLGKRIQFNPGEDAQWSTVVGVNRHITQDVPMQSTLGGRNPWVYAPLAQQTPADFYVVLRSKATPVLNDITQVLREALAEVDRNVAIESIYALDYRQRAAMTWVVGLGKILIFISIAALVLSIIGIYGIISRSVLLRASEIGIRQAIGASRLNIISVFLKQGVAYLFVGIVIGGGLGILVSSRFTSFSISVVNYIPFVFAIVLVSLSLLVFLASYFPTRKVLSIDPGDALRYE